MTPNHLGAIDPVKDSESSPFRMRTRSASMQDGVFVGDDFSTAATSLHSSFDATMLGTNDASQQIFRGAPPRVSLALSWDEGRCDLSSRKEVPPQDHTKGEFDVIPPTTIRKATRSSIIDSNQTPSKNFMSKSGDLHAGTPSSSSRRRKAAPLDHRKGKSPYHQRVPPVSTPISSFPTRDTVTSVLKETPSSFQATPLPNHPSHTVMKAKLQTGNTTSTANSSSLDITVDTEQSHESPTTTPFHFTTFPASLPRVPPSEKQILSARKKACFSKAELEQLDSTVMKRARPTNGILDELNQNSSNGSISGYHSTIERDPSFPPPDLEWRSPRMSAKTLLSKYSEDSDTEQSRPVPHGLFLDNPDNYTSDDSPVRLNVPRTRLDFNTVSGPSNSQDDESTHFNEACNPEANLSPARRPTSPGELQFRVGLDDAQCSPILPRKDMEYDDTSPLERQLSPVAEAPTGSVNQSIDDSKLSLSQESSVSSSSSSKQRRLRPMPDMSAFESRQSNRSGASPLVEKRDDSAPSSNKLTCPPTPVRTPAWAHGEASVNPFHRANSLTMTKVLATCPAQIVDGHSSLESSTMEDEATYAGDIERRRASLSFSTVDEQMEDLNDEVPKAEDDTSPITQGELKSGEEAFEEEHSINPNTPMDCRASKGGVSKSSDVTEGSPVSFGKSFENLGRLGSGAFADVYKVRSKVDSHLYAVKRNRRQFRGKRDRDMAMAEVRTMQKLQTTSATAAKAKTNYSLYVLFFFRAWQEEGYFHCQTELCCRDTLRELTESLRSKWSTAVTIYPSLTKHLGGKGGSMSVNGSSGRLVPDFTIWKVCHDISAGLSHIHANGIVHHDIKPSNIFFVPHPRLGAMCKIGDFGMAGEIGTAEDGQEGDTVYMPPELLSSSVKHPGADIFSLGLTLYELASSIGWEMPVEGPGWHELRGGSHVPDLPQSRHPDLIKLIQATIKPEKLERPSANDILTDMTLVKEAGCRCDEFLRDYLDDVETFDRIQEERGGRGAAEQTPRNMDHQRELLTPTPGIPLVPSLFTPTLS